MLKTITLTKSEAERVPQKVTNKVPNWATSKEPEKQGKNKKGLKRPAFIEYRVKWSLDK